MTKAIPFILGIVLASVFSVTTVLAQSDDSTATTPKSACPEGEVCLLEPFPDDENLKIDTDGSQGGAIYLMEQYVSKFYIFGAGFVAVIAVIWIMIGGYEIMVSGATSAGDISAGKEKITKALLGLVIVFLSALILHTINPEFFSYRE